MVDQIKLHIGMLIMICLGTFFTPAISYACSSHTSHHESKCGGENSRLGHADKSHYTCADFHRQSKVARNHGHCPCGQGCDGNCQGRSCKCDACGCSAGVVIPLLFKSYQEFPVYRKLLFPTHQAYVCSGFNSIWLPPKIG